ncbi:MAG: hypothetical protein ABFQ53_03570 [Patescibacteria group bacterium]
MITRKIFFIIFSLGSLLFFAGIIQGESVSEKFEINSKTGEVRVAQSQWRPLVHGEQMAYESSGTEIPIFSDFETERDGFFYYIRKNLYTEAFVYDGEKIEKIKTSGSKDGERKFALHIALWLVASIVVVMGIVLNKDFLEGARFIIFLINMFSVTFCVAALSGVYSFWVLIFFACSFFSSNRLERGCSKKSVRVIRLTSSLCFYIVSIAFWMIYPIS